MQPVFEVMKYGNEIQQSEFLHHVFLMKIRGYLVKIDWVRATVSP